MIPNSFSSTVGAKFELLAALNQSIQLHCLRKSLQIDSDEKCDQLNLSQWSWSYLVLELVIWTVVTADTRTLKPALPLLYTHSIRILQSRVRCTSLEPSPYHRYPWINPSTAWDVSRAYWVVVLCVPQVTSSMSMSLDTLDKQMVELG